MRIYTATGLVVRVPNQQVYLRDRLVVEAFSPSAKYSDCTLVVKDKNGITVEMQTVFNGIKSVCLDISSVMRTYKARNSFSVDVYTNNGESIVSGIPFSIAGDVNPKFFPPHPLPPLNSVFSNDALKMLPPVKMYRLPFTDPDTMYNLLIADIYTETTETLTLQQLDEDGNEISSDTLINGEYEILTECVELRLLEKSNDVVMTRKLIPCKCGNNYVLVSWKSRSGNMKRAVWELINMTEDVSSVTELLNIGSPAYQADTHPVTIHKGYNAGAVLRLDSLCAYDYWYYSDIVTSDEVAVYVNSAEESIDTDKHIVEVTTKSISMPNGDADAPYTLDINIILNRYDEI